MTIFRDSWRCENGTLVVSEDPVARTSVANPHLCVAPPLLGVVGCIDSIKERLLFVEVSAVHRIVEPHHPLRASAMPADLEHHRLHWNILSAFNHLMKGDCR
jgi:hypothetical protein